MIEGRMRSQYGVELARSAHENDIVYFDHDIVAAEARRWLDEA